MAQTKYKLARCSKYGPPERNLEEVKELERRFVLDCVAVSTFSDDSGRANPKMSTAIPPYNAQKDKHAKEYFQKPVTKNLLKKTEQVSTFLKIHVPSQLPVVFHAGRAKEFTVCLFTVSSLPFCRVTKSICCEI